MVIDDDGDSRREERIERSFVERVRMISDLSRRISRRLSQEWRTYGSENKKVHDVDDPYSQSLNEILFEQRGGSDDFEGRFNSDSDQDDVGIDTIVDRES